MEKRCGVRWLGNECQCGHSQKAPISAPNGKHVCNPPPLKKARKHVSIGPFFETVIMLIFWQPFVLWLKVKLFYGIFLRGGLLMADFLGLVWQIFSAPRPLYGLKTGFWPRNSMNSRNSRNSWHILGSPYRRRHQGHRQGYKISL